MITRIITSGAYVGSELEAEFGHLPPSFLPVGGSLLITHQIEMLRGDDVDLILTLPDDFSVDPALIGQLETGGVTVMRLPADISLGESVALALATAKVAGTVDIVHGDTLIAPPAAPVVDGFAVAAVTDGYAWSHVAIEEGRILSIASARTDPPLMPPVALTGFFRFSDAIALLHALVRTRHSFIEALDEYCRATHVMALPSPGWLDLGHLQTYFRSRHALAASRHFNSLRIEDGLVHKSSDDRFKIDAEARWLAGLPPALRLYGTRLIAHDPDAEPASYATEYAYLPTLAEISLSQLGSTGWQPIVAAVDSYLGRALASPGAVDGNVLYELAIAKLNDRVASHPDAYPDFDRPLTINGRGVPAGREIVAHLREAIEGAPPVPTAVMHGDFCFSNILYSSRTTRISVIDPRGYVRPGKAEIGGDLRYDLAKLAHSAIGGYDRIVAGQFRHERTGDAITFVASDNAPDVVRLFTDREFAGIRLTRPDIAATMISLFISMVPLHADRPERQQAFYANALRLYADHFGGAA